MNFVLINPKSVEINRSSSIELALINRYWAFKLICTIEMQTIKNALNIDFINSSSTVAHLPPMIYLLYFLLILKV